MKAELRVIQGKPRDVTRPLEQGDCLIGRGEECHIRTSSPWVSRQHCIVRLAHQDVFLQDLGSTNGTLLNGKRVVGELPLQSGDRIQIGPLAFEILIHDRTSTMTETGQMVVPETYRISTKDLPRLDPAEPLARKSPLPLPGTQQFKP